MRQLTRPAWIKLKGFLFLLLGATGFVLVVLENRSVEKTALLVITVWCFCRFYFFAFYVIERYVDSSYKFSGIGSFLHYVYRTKWH